MSVFISIQSHFVGNIYCKQILSEEYALSLVFNKVEVTHVVSERELVSIAKASKKIIMLPIEFEPTGNKVPPNQVFISAT
jgi:hypothetical protein